VCGPNHVKLEYNSCGCVYSLDVDDTMSATTLEALVRGNPCMNSVLCTCTHTVIESAERD
jgi:hypothetical protein